MPLKQILWVDKYRPVDVADIVGNGAKIKRLQDWLSGWEGNSRDYKIRDQKAKAIIISGPPGVGKTTSAKLVCSKLGYDCFEVNASDSRNKSTNSTADGMKNNVLAMVREMVTNSSIAFGKLSPKMALVMDEVDGMSSGDRGGVMELVKIIKDTRIPIICICNDKYSPKLKSLLNHCEDCAFQRPLKLQVAKFAANVAQKEGISITEDSLIKLVELCDNDVRLVLNQLQFLSSLATRHHQAYDSSLKDIPGNPFTNTERLFNRAGNTLCARERLALSDSDIMCLFVQENYVNIRPQGATTEFDRLNLVAAAATRCSDADVLNKAVYIDQIWSMLPASTMTAAVLPASIVSGGRELLSASAGERNFHRFPSVLGKISSRSKISRLCHELFTHFTSDSPCAATRVQLRLEYFPLLRIKTLRDMTFIAKGGREQTGIEGIVAFMQDYNINRTDWDTLHESTRLSGKGPPFQPTVSVLCSKVKAAFTKRCKCLD